MYTVPSAYRVEAALRQPNTYGSARAISLMAASLTVPPHVAGHLCGARASQAQSHLWDPAVLQWLAAIAMPSTSSAYGVGGTT